MGKFGKGVSEMDVNDKLWDYTICLENAIKIITQESLEKFGALNLNPEEGHKRELMNKEVEILTRIERDLKRVINDINYKTYWDYLDTEEEEE